MEVMTMAEVLQTNDILQQMTDEQLIDIQDKIATEITIRREKQVKEAIKNFKQAWYALTKLGQSIVMNNTVDYGDEIFWEDIYFSGAEE